MHLEEQISNSVEETKSIAKDFLTNLELNDVVVLSGDLGAGKTQFVQGLASALGVEEQVISPTFNILLEYECKNPLANSRLKNSKSLSLYHFDLYRLEDESELEDINFYETIEAGGISLIEWGEKFISEITNRSWHVIIQRADNNSRTIKIERVKNG